MGLVLKVMIMGRKESGKIELMGRFRSPIANLTREAIGVDFRAVKIALPNKEQVTFQIWDLDAEQERTKFLWPGYFTGSYGAI